MGVKDLWPILSSVQCHKPLTELRGKRIAIDLAIWVCEVQAVRMAGVHKPHLRHIFFRVSNLLHLGVTPIFVVDGDPPELKWGTMMSRQSARGGKFGQGRGNSAGACRKQNRSHFKGVLNECCQLLEHLGVPYVQSVGEAEATCAQLNKNGFVDACLTNDGDAFLYGAQTVYRNFTLDRKDSHVECYEMTDIERTLGLDRDRLISLALLLGCDYCPKGVAGIGREIALKFLAETDKQPILEKFLKWRKDPEHYLSQAALLTQKPAHCTNCRHPGSSRAHQKSGCVMCDSFSLCEPNSYDYKCRCSWHITQASSPIGPVEVSLMQKALHTPGFPDERVISEFLKAGKSNHSKSRIEKCSRPKMFHLQRFAVSRMEWTDQYALEKVLPLVTLYDLHQLKTMGAQNKLKTLKPDSIVKSRVRQGVACLEINWSKVEGDVSSSGEYYTTIEDRDLVMAAFPSLVTAFEEQKASKKTKKKTNSTKDVECTDSDIIDHKPLVEVTSQYENTQSHSDLSGRVINGEKSHKKKLISSLEQENYPCETTRPESSHHTVRSHRDKKVKPSNHVVEKPVQAAHLPDPTKYIPGPAADLCDLLETALKLSDSDSSSADDDHTVPLSQRLATQWQKSQKTKENKEKTKSSTQSVSVDVSRKFSSECVDNIKFDLPTKADKQGQSDTLMEKRRDVINTQHLSSSKQKLTVLEQYRNPAKESGNTCASPITILSDADDDENTEYNRSVDIDELNDCKTEHTDNCKQQNTSECSIKDINTAGCKPKSHSLLFPHLTNNTLSERFNQSQVGDFQLEMSLLSNISNLSNYSLLNNTSTHLDVDGDTNDKGNSMTDTNIERSFGAANAEYCCNENSSSLQLYSLSNTSTDRSMDDIHNVDISSNSFHVSGTIQNEVEIASLESELSPHDNFSLSQFDDSVDESRNTREEYDEYSKVTYLTRDHIGIDVETATSSSLAPSWIKYGNSLPTTPWRSVEKSMMSVENMEFSTPVLIPHSANHQLYNLSEESPVHFVDSPFNSTCEQSLITSTDNMTAESESTLDDSVFNMRDHLGSNHTNTAISTRLDCSTRESPVNLLERLRKRLTTNQEGSHLASLSQLTHSSQRTRKSANDVVILD